MRTESHHSAKMALLQNAPVSGSSAVLLSNKQVAALMSISESHLHALKQSGRFGPSPIRLGRAIRYSRQEVLKWLEAGAPPLGRWRAMQAHTK